MTASNKFNAFLCMALLIFTAISEKSVFLTDHTGIQASVAQHQGNTDDDPDLCLLKPTHKHAHEFYRVQLSVQNTNQKHVNHLRRSARAPPFV